MKKYSGYKSTSSILIAVCLLFSLSSGFVLQTSRGGNIVKARQVVTKQPSTINYKSLLFQSNNDGNEISEKNAKPIKSTSFPYASYFLVIVTVRSFTQIVTLPTEIPGAFLFPDPNYQIDFVATAFDLFFVWFGCNELLQQNGIIGGNNNKPVELSETTSLSNLECRITLNVGRERGTMMEPEWAASGARLLLPVNLKFSNQPVKIDFPGEESMGGRFCYSLDVLDDSVTFIGPQGEVKVNVQGGAWTTLPITERKTENGEAKLRFFLDFPDGASRNDVTLPTGRIFFSGLYAPNESVTPLTEGRITMKKNGLLNFYGTFGDVNAILGRYKVDSVKI